jgi:hypothetical protein
MYSSRIGRWLSVDPYAQYWSPYLAMGNNPVSRVDPDGGFDGAPGGDPSLWQRLKTFLFGVENPPLEGISQKTPKSGPAPKAKAPAAVSPNRSSAPGPGLTSYVGFHVNTFSMAFQLGARGAKPRYTPRADWKAFKLASNSIAKNLGRVGIALTIGDMAYSRSFTTSHKLDLIFGGVSFAGFPGALVGSAYTIVNFTTEAVTGKSIGKQIDDNFYILPVNIPGSPFILIPK